MPVAALQKLRPAQPRSFVPAGTDLGDWAQLEPLFKKLELSAASIKSAADLEQWVMNASELGAALDQEGSRRYINMTCQTDDPENEKAYLHFIESIDLHATTVCIAPHRHDLLTPSRPHRVSVPGSHAPGTRADASVEHGRRRSRQ